MLAVLHFCNLTLHTGTHSCLIVPTSCSYSVSAKTGRNLMSTFLCIAANLAGVPLTQQQLDTAADAGSSPTGHLQQLKVDLPASPTVGSAVLRSRKPGSCIDAHACSVSPKQQAMQRTAGQQEAGAGSGEEGAEGTAAGLGSLRTCRCCCHCAHM
jgi:hypothetical protein